MSCELRAVSCEQGSGTGLIDMLESEGVIPSLSAFMAKH
jgi:hypothetical protein